MNNNKQMRGCYESKTAKGSRDWILLSPGWMKKRLFVPGVFVKIVFIRRFCQRFRFFPADYGVAGVTVQSVLLLQFTPDNTVADVRAGGFDTAGGE